MGPQYLQRATLGLLMFVAIVTPSTAVAENQASNDEDVVRASYAKLSYADEVHIMKEMLRPSRNTDAWKADRRAADRAIQERLSFQLSNFKSGNVADIEQQKLSDLVTVWDEGSDTLRANPGVWNYTYTEGDNKISASVPYGTFFWEKSPYPRTEVADWPLSQVLAKGPEFHGPYSHFVSYTVSVTFQRHSLTYNALALFRQDGEVYFIDNVTSATMLVFLAKTPMYPAPLAETHLRNVPFVQKWLTDHQQACSPGHQAKSDACCDLKTGACGIGVEDLRSPSHALPREGKQGPTSKKQTPKELSKEPQLVLAGFRPRVPIILAQATGVASCESANQTRNFLHFLANDKDHITGNHNFTSNIPVVCSYTSGAVGQQNCNVQCSSGSAGVPDESGIPLVWPFHPKNTSDFSGQAFTVSGSAQCQGTSAVAFMGCILPGCAIGISITASANGVGATVNFPPGSLWNDQNQGLVTCNAIPQPTPTPTPDPPPPPPPIDPCLDGAANGFIETGGPAPVCSPIILDLEGKGFSLTSAADGVRFDITGTGHPIQLAWTAPGAQNGFLAMDRNGNGTIDDGTELFGNFTPQPASPHRNGFLALAVYDQPENGGNGDGIIDARDSVFSSLRVWVDANHDGICYPSELHMLPEMGVFSLSLDYSLSRRQDEFGNVFRYKARVNPRGSPPADDIGKKAYDVFLVTH